MTIISTWGGRESNAYITREEANAWIRTNRINHDEWELADEGIQTAALLQATRNIDSCVWHGTRFYDTQQALAFPRVQPGEDFPYGAGSSGEPDQAFFNGPQADLYRRQQFDRVRAATCVQALYALRNEGHDADREDQFRGKTSVSRGARYAESASYGHQNMVLHPEAWDLLRYYKGTPRVVRG